MTFPHGWFRTKSLAGKVTRVRGKSNQFKGLVGEIGGQFGALVCSGSVITPGPGMGESSQKRERIGVPQARGSRGGSGAVPLGVVDATVEALAEGQRSTSLRDDSITLKSLSGKSPVGTKCL